ncbi:signal peptidase 22kDa subunit [Trichophaea hybrida]|nr:signal peptidase 22kDa subunit [Trichophaea hybrida]
MHSTIVRIQNVFGFFTTVAFFVAFFTALSVVLYPASPTATVDVVSVKVIKGRPQYYSSKQQEYAFITFDLDADLESLYNWNTKQVFCWLSVVYGGGKGTKHVSARLPSSGTH